MAIPKVETVVIRQHEMPEWARDIVWDCTTPHDCHPVQRSDGSTRFAAKKQINREQFLNMAREVDNLDNEIVSQIGGGGVESDSECELITVLAFHHGGLLKEFGAAQKTISNEWEERWTTKPTRHLPFVPCRLLPRNVVLQERVRLVEGKVDPLNNPVTETYWKARVTLDSSYGGADSVNAAVPSPSSAVALPRVQWLAKAVAITELAGDSLFDAVDTTVLNHSDIDFNLQPQRPVHAQQYVIDDESAYPHLPVQRAIRWQQCFIWCGDDGSTSGVCSCEMLTFGGAKVFQTAQTVIDRWAMKLIREFDRANPLPPTAQMWQLLRQQAQFEGELPPGEDQLEPSYIHNYIDDNCGTALDDPVPVSYTHLTLPTILLV